MFEKKDEKCYLTVFVFGFRNAGASKISAQIQILVFLPAFQFLVFFEPQLCDLRTFTNKQILLLFCDIKTRSGSWDQFSFVLQKVLVMIKSEPCHNVIYIITMKVRLVSLEKFSIWVKMISSVFLVTKALKP